MYSVCVCVCVCVSGIKFCTHCCIVSLVCTVPLHQQFLFDAATNGNLPAALCALAHGANVNYVSLENDCRTALLEAVDAVSVCGCGCKCMSLCVFVCV